MGLKAVDLLLTLSRSQKVGYMKISILTLARQYLAFVERAKKLRLNWQPIIL